MVPGRQTLFDNTCTLCHHTFKSFIPATGKWKTSNYCGLCMFKMHDLSIIAFFLNLKVFLLKKDVGRPFTVTSVVVEKTNNGAGTVYQVAVSTKQGLRRFFIQWTPVNGRDIIPTHPLNNDDLRLPPFDAMIGELYSFSHEDLKKILYEFIERNKFQGITINREKTF